MAQNMDKIPEDEFPYDMAEPTSPDPRLNQTVDSLFQTFGKEVKGFWVSRRASPLAWTTFMVLNLANCLMVIWFIAPGWAWTEETGAIGGLEGEFYGYYGIWYSCWEMVSKEGIQTCSLTEEVVLMDIPGYWEATEGLSICILLFGLAAFANMIVYLCARKMNHNTCLMIVVSCLLYLTGVLNVVCFIVFSAEFEYKAYWCCGPEPNRELHGYHLWYAFGLACVSSACYLVAGICATFEVLNLKREQRLQELYEEMERRHANQPYSLDETYSYDARMMRAPAMWPQAMPMYR